MASTPAAPKVTTNVGGVPYTQTVAKAAKAAANIAPTPGVAPARGQAGWVDPVRAAGDTTFSAKFGTPTPGELANANDPSAAPPAAAPPQTAIAPATAPPQAPNSLQAATDAQGTANQASQPVTTPAAAPTPTPTQNKYQAGLQAAVNSGAPPPVDAGAARTATTALTPQDAPDTSAVDQYMSQDPGITKLMSGITDLLSPKNQTTTLMQDYQKLYKSSGLADINSEIIDTNKVINGTEDDVRNEIQKAGGFGTESQVQAMSLARNKSLLLRYNQLVQMKTDATNQLSTMMTLDSSDKQMAQTKVTQQIDTMFNMANFRQTAIQNTRQQQQFLLQQDPVGYYNSLSKDPRQLAMAEQIMGTGPGGIQQYAQHAKEQQDFARSVQEQQLAISRGNLAVSQGGLALERQKYQDSLKASHQTSAQLQIQGYADRTKSANEQISQLGGKFTGLASKLGGILPNVFKSSDRQQYEQAQRNFVNSVLRRESGAAISQSEFDSASKQYFPQPGDSPNTVAQKTANRNMVINNLYQQAGATRTAGAGDMIVGPDGNHYLVGADGNMTPL